MKWELIISSISRAPLKNHWMHESAKARHHGISASAPRKSTFEIANGFLQKADVLDSG